MGKLRQQLRDARAANGDVNADIRHYVVGPWMANEAAFNSWRNGRRSTNGGRNYPSPLYGKFQNKLTTAIAQALIDASWGAILNGNQRLQQRVEAARNFGAKRRIASTQIKIWWINNKARGIESARQILLKTVENEGSVARLTQRLIGVIVPTPQSSAFSSGSTSSSSAVLPPQ